MKRNTVAKYANLALDIVFVGFGIHAVVNGQWWGVGFFVLAGFSIAMDYKSYWKRSEPTEADYAEEWAQRGYDGDIPRPVDLRKQGVEPMPTPGDEFDPDAQFEESMEHWEQSDIEILKGLWKKEQHRQARPDCRYCAYLDKRQESK
jgi:hypothetical protein